MCIVMLVGSLVQVQQCADPSGIAMSTSPHNMGVHAFSYLQYYLLILPSAPCAASAASAASS